MDTAAVGSLVAGRISTLTKHDGDVVKAGKIITQLDSDIAQQALKQIKSQRSVEIENLNQRAREFMKVILPAQAY